MRSRFHFFQHPFVDQSPLKPRPLAGSYISFLGRGKRPVHIYGVLARGLTDIAAFGTYLLHSTCKFGNKGDFVTLDRKTLYLAWLRVNNKDETSLCKDNLPKRELDELFQIHNSNPLKFLALVEDSEQKYMANMARLQLLKEQARKKKEALNPKIPATRRATSKSMRTIALGSNVAAQFKNRELYVHLGCGEMLNLEDEWMLTNADNQKLLAESWAEETHWFEGEVTQIRLNQKRKKVFACTYNTPKTSVHEYDTIRVKSCMKSYHDLQLYEKKQRALKAQSLHKRGADSSDSEFDDGLSDDDVEHKGAALPLGTKLRHGVSVQNSSSQPRQLHHSGEVIQIRKLPTGEFEYCCSFATTKPAACWFNEQTTVAMATNHVSHQDKMLQAEGDTGRVACKGSNQRQTVQEACQVVVRPKVVDTHLSTSKQDDAATVAPDITIAKGTALCKHVGTVKALGEILGIHYTTHVDGTKTVVYDCIFKTQPPTVELKVSAFQVRQYVTNVQPQNGDVDKAAALLKIQKTAATPLRQPTDLETADKKKLDEEEAATLLSATLNRQQTEAAAAEKKKLDEEEAATLLRQQREAAAADKKKLDEEESATLLREQREAAAADKKKLDEEEAAAKKKQDDEEAATLLRQQTEVEAATTSYRHAHLIPLLPGGKLDDNHCMVLYDAMVRYFGIDKDTEVICPDDARYDVFIRVHTFEPYAEHSLKEFIALMDVVCEPHDPSLASNTQDGTTSRYVPSTPLDAGDYTALQEKMARYFGFEKDGEVILPGEDHYDLFMRIRTFDIDKNDINDFNELMDIVCEGNVDNGQCDIMEKDATSGFGCPRCGDVNDPAAPECVKCAYCIRHLPDTNSMSATCGHFAASTSVETSLSNTYLSQKGAYILDQLSAASKKRKKGGIENPRNTLDGERSGQKTKKKKKKKVLVRCDEVQESNEGIQVAGGKPATESTKKLKKKKVIDNDPTVEIQAAAGRDRAVDITHEAVTSKKKKKKRRVALGESDELASSHVDNDKDTSLPHYSGITLDKKRKKKQCVENQKAFLTQVIPMEQLANAKGHPSCVYIALSCAVLSRHVLSCLGLSFLVLSCLVLSWADIAKRPTVMGGHCERNSKTLRGTEARHF